MHRALPTLGLGVAAAGALYLALPSAPAPTPVPLAAPPPISAPSFAPNAAPPTLTTGGPLELGLTLDLNALPTDAAATRYAVVTLHAPEAADSPRVPVDLALVMDTSGSMASQGKLEQAKRAAASLASTLGASDRLALVSFSGGAELPMPLGAVDVGRAQILIGRLPIGSGTNLGAGLQLGFEALSDSTRVRKLILLTDGQANEGVTEPNALVALARREGVTVSALGIGLDYNEALLPRLADAGGGMYQFVDSTTDLDALYAAELRRAATQVARSTRLDLTFPTGLHPVRVYAWDADIRGQSVGLDIGSLAAGQTRTVVVMLAADAAGSAPDPVEARVYGTAAGTGAAFGQVATLPLRRVATAQDAQPFANGAAQSAAASAVAAAGVADAADAYRRGDVAQGQATLRATATSLRQKAGEYGNSALVGEADKLKALRYLDAGEGAKAASKSSRWLGRSEEY